MHSNEKPVQDSPETPPIPKHKHHYVRTFFAGVFGFLGLGLIIVSIFVLSLSNTITDTDTYVKTVAKVVKEKPVQDFVVARVTSAVMDNKDISMEGLSSNVIPNEQRLGKTEAELRVLIEPLIKEDLMTIVSSPSFEKLWTDTNRDMHTKIVGALNSNGQDVNYDFRPLIDGVVGELANTRFSYIAEKVEIPEGKGAITVPSAKIDPARRIYNYFKYTRIAIVGLAFICISASIALSVHHIRTMRRILVFNGVFFGILAGLLSATRQLDKLNGDPIDKAAVITVVGILFHDLKIASIVIAVICLVVAIGSKIIEKIRSPKKK